MWKRQSSDSTESNQTEERQRGDLHSDESMNGIFLGRGGQQCKENEQEVFMEEELR